MTHLLRLITLIVTCSQLFAQDPEALLSAGENQLLSGDFIGAEASYNAALEADQYYAPAHQGLSKLYLYKANFSQAYNNAIKAVELDNDNYRVWMDQMENLKQKFQNAKRSIKNGMYDEAMKVCNEILNDYPYSSEAEYYLGYVGLARKDREMAAKHFKQALSIFPNYKKANSGLHNVTKQSLNAGNKSYKRGNLSKATSYYQKALEFDPNFYLAYYQLGVLEKKLGHSQTAIDHLNKVIEIKPEHDKTWFTLGSIYESDGNTELAIEHYNKAIELNPGYSKAYGNLGKLYTESQEYKLADDVLKTVTQIDPNYADGFMRLGLLYIRQEMWVSAVDNLIISTDLDNKDYNKFINLASALNKLERWDEASVAARFCTDLKQNFGGGWYELGISEMGRKNKTRAKKHFERAHNDREWRKMAARKIDEINNPAKYEK